MHPNLALHAHPMCKDQIRALEDCHKSHPYMKFLGKCNQVRRQLDVCLGEEFEVVRGNNMAQRNAKRQHMLDQQK